jgi:putative component of membrane protein insertase Oxa1/YidC/SpoIIIJ protein YidD
VRGALLGSWRLLRCNPFSNGGFDPVPERFTLRVKPIDPADYYGEAKT